MRTDWRKKVAVCLCFCVVLMFCGPIVLGDDKPAPKIDDLLKKRLAAVEEVRRALWALTTSGRQFDWLEMRDATVEVPNARLELAKSPNDRIKVFEAMLKDVEGLEQLCLKRFQAARGQRVTIIQARALALKLQIELERAKKELGQPTAKR